MAIKGLSERVRLPRLGKIRLGIKVPTAKGDRPKAVDYFVCPDEIKGFYGETPRELPVMFPGEDDSRWAQQFYKCYSRTRGLICRGDGEIADALIDTETGEIASAEAKDVVRREVICNPNECIMQQKGYCKQVMNLQFLLPEVPGLGVWQIDTTSINSILNINSSVYLVRKLLGRIGGIPLKLTLSPVEVAPDGKKKTVWVLGISVPFSLAEMLHMVKQLPANEVLMLPEPEPENYEEFIIGDDEDEDGSQPGPGPEAESKPDPEPEPLPKMQPKPAPQPRPAPAPAPQPEPLSEPENVSKGRAGAPAWKPQKVDKDAWSILVKRMQYDTTDKIEAALGCKLQAWKGSRLDAIDVLFARARSEKRVVASHWLLLMTEEQEAALRAFNNA